MLSRIGWIALTLLCVGALWLATRLEPSPTGWGTHMQLGLPPCGFLVLTGRPCPSCGMTTAFLRIGEGDLSGAAASNSGSILLYAGMALNFAAAFAYTMLRVLRHANP